MEPVEFTFARAEAVEKLTQIIQSGDCLAIYRAILFSIHLFEDLKTIPVATTELKEFVRQYIVLLNSVRNTPLIGSIQSFESSGPDANWLIVELLKSLDVTYLRREDELKISRVILNTFTYDATTHEIWNRKRKRIRLSDRLNTIFSTLLYKRNIPVTFEELDDNWSVTADTTHDLEQAISSLRELLHTLHCGIKIKSVYNVGYRLEI